MKDEGLLESVVDLALYGLAAFARDGTFEQPAKFRLAFRELGLSIGLSAAEKIQECLVENPGLFRKKSYLERRTEELMAYAPLGKTIEQFWMEEENRQAVTWTEHREINMVMLATSLAPGRFLRL